MEYLQYLIMLYNGQLYDVLNLIINGIPSILIDYNRGFNKLWEF